MTSEMTIFNEIVKHQIEGLMFHIDCANVFDFLGMCGFKREQEYHALSEFIEMRGVERYVINHISYIPNGNGANRPASIIPDSWYNANRCQVGDADRKGKIKEIYSKWREWETETKLFYQHKYQELVELGAIASANKVNCLIKNVDKELKCVEREYIEYNAVTWDMVYIMEKQDKIHDIYEEKTRNNLKIEMC